MWPGGQKTRNAYRILENIRLEYLEEDARITAWTLGIEIVEI
jgi:hypothetical protein